MLTRKIRISRSKFIEDNIEIAIIRLNNAQHLIGQPIMVRYYSDSMKTEVDTLYAIGVKDGTGQDSYKMISIKGLSLINGVTRTPEDLPDVSALVHGELYLSWLNEKWNYVYEVDNQRIIEPIIGDSYAFVNVEDRYTWFYKDGILKREDDFLSKEQIEDLLKDLNESLDQVKEQLDNLKKEIENLINWIKKIDNEVFPFILKVEYPEGDLFLKEDLTKNVKINIKGFKENELVDVSKFDVFINDSPVTLEENGDVIIPNLNNTTELYIRGVLKESQLSSDTILAIIYFEDYTYIKLIPEDWNIESEGSLDNLTKLLRKKSDLDIKIDLNLERLIYLSPESFGELVKITDENGIDYLNDYVLHKNVKIDNKTYNLYEKEIAIKINNFNQKFTYGN